MGCGGVLALQRLKFGFWVFSRLVWAVVSLLFAAVFRVALAVVVLAPSGV